MTVITDQRAILPNMKEQQTNKSYISRLTRVLPCDFNIEHIPGAKMGLIDYTSRQPNQKAKFTKSNSDKNIAVAAVARICDAISSS